VKSAPRPITKGEASLRGQPHAEGRGVRPARQPTCRPRPRTTRLCRWRSKLLRGHQDQCGVSRPTRRAPSCEVMVVAVIRNERAGRLSGRPVAFRVIAISGG